MESPPVSSQTLPPGTRLEEFVIERVLGSGGFGITYLATDTALGRQVVIKENLPAQFCFRDTHSLTVAPRHTQGDDADNFQWSLENFSKESAMLASLDHPGIVRVLRSFQAFGTAYFVMPYVEGVALDELYKQRNGRSFAEGELTAWLERMLDALGHLHDRGIYHRDIKPGNLLITDDGIPVLIDFGSARQRLSERSLTVVESAGYTPFEQLQSRGNVGPWSDLYALGATLVKVITGETPPKTNDRTMGDPWQPLSGRQELKGSYSEVFLAGIDRALRLPTEERWQSAEEWKLALASGKLPEVEFAKTAGQSVKPARPQTGMTGRTLILFAVTAVLLLAVGGWWWRSGALGTPILVAAPGGLVLTSDPSSARVLDAGGSELGLTPLELKGLPSGQAWEGRIELQNYVAAAVREEVLKGETRLVPPVKLLPQPQKVIVTSEPAGAEVLEGGKVLGVTPWESDPREVGSAVALILRLQGYQEAAVDGKVELGRTLMLQGTMKPVPQKVRVTSEPAGAEVVEDGVVLGITPWESDPREVGGAVALTLRLPGYQEGVVDGKVEMGGALMLQETMKLMHQKVKVTSEPTGAEVLEGGKVLGVTPWDSDPREVGSEVALRLRLPGYEEESVDGKIELGSPLMLQGTMKPVPQKVRVTSEPEGATVLEGGSIIGQTPFVQNFMPGTKVIYQLKLDGHEDAQVEGEVLAGKSLELTAVLKMLPRRSFEGAKAGEEKYFEIAPGVKITFCWCPPGKFTMGSPTGELGRFSDENQVEVTLSRGFWLAKTELTQGQWKAAGGIFVSGRPPAFWDGKVQHTWDQFSDEGILAVNFIGDRLPVERVDWNESRDWCSVLTSHLRDDGKLGKDWKLALPTEAQWEYACRAGTTTALHSGRNLTLKEGFCVNLAEVGWYNQNSGKGTQPVGQKKANAWGLHDMHGNVWEWCADWYGGEFAGGLDPKGPATGVHRAGRSGSWYFTVARCRASYRYGSLPDFRDFNLGFRPALVPSE